MSLEVKILWLLVGAIIAPFVMVAGVSIGFTINQVIDPILAGGPPPLAPTVMLITGLLALWLIWSAIRNARATRS